jgi:hypothetical protein
MSGTNNLRLTAVGFKVLTGGSDFLFPHWFAV